MAVVEITIVPIGTGEPSLSKYISKALEELEDADVKYELTSSGTLLEGDLDKVLSIAKRMHESVFDQEISRVVTYLQIDDRRDKSLTIKGKKKSVEKKMKDPN